VRIVGAHVLQQQPLSWLTGKNYNLTTHTLTGTLTLGRCYHERRLKTEIFCSSQVPQRRANTPTGIA
jgi:hypothetical protein